MSSSQPGWFPDPADHSKLRWWDGVRWTPGVSRDGRVWDEPLPVTESSPPRRRLPVWAWVLIGLVLLVPILLLSPLVAPVALVILITGVIGLIKGSRTWLRLRSRRAAIGVTAGAAVLLLITGGISAAALTRPADAPVAVEPAPFADSGDASAGADEATPTPRPTRTPTATPTPVTTTREEIVTEAIAFDQTTLEDANLPRGQTVISVGGQAGQRTLTYVITVVDGVETGRELKSDVVTVAPVTEVTAIGTYDAPVAAPAPPAASGCDSNYADACVPIASDVDCAWGTGDGPAYFDGVARVVGSDVYGLDRNNDGWACEQ
jgi:hypothetical protein